MKKILLCITGIAFIVASIPAWAEQSKSLGDYTVHYNAFTTDVLSPEVARSYGIQRSSNRALLNISILKRTGDKRGTPVKAEVNVTATNLSAQLRELDMREVVETGAVYYLGLTKVEHGEILTYNIEITPAGARTTYSFSFQQQFVTDY